MKNMIGNTPLLEVTYKYKGEIGTIYAKLEFFNLTGSIKDRVAKYTIEQSYIDGSLKKGMPIVEATSGNTGISFSALGAMYKHPVHIFMPDWMSSERKALIKKYGATLHLVSEEDGGFIECIKRADEFALEVNGFRPRQFCNPYNSESHYETTGVEIVAQLDKIDKIPDILVAGVGTGGTVMGAGRRFKEVNPKAIVMPLEPSNSPTLTYGCRVGSHRIQGISDEFIPALLDLDYLDEIIMVDDGDSIIMAQMFSKQLGLGVGISSGANFLGAVIAQQKYGKDKTVVTIFSDDSKKYLSTGLINDEPIKEGFLSTDIELISFDGNCICEKRIIEKTC